jgi:prolyl-tRNA synthetase
VILPVLHKAESASDVLQYCHRVAAELRDVQYHGRPIVVEIDERDIRGGEKMWSWIKNGIPLRAEIGPRDMENDAVFLGRRDRGPKDKAGVGRSELVATITSILDEMQLNLYENAKTLRQSNTKRVESRGEFDEFFAINAKDSGSVKIQGGFALAPYAATSDEEEAFAKESGVTVRCIPVDTVNEPGTCIISGRPSMQRAVFARAY